jgi:hypothetical protein
VSINRDTSLGWIDFSCQTLKASCFTCSRNSEKCEALSVLKTEGDIFNGGNWAIGLLKVTKSYWELFWLFIHNSLFLLNNVFINEIWTIISFHAISNATCRISISVSSEVKHF